MVTSTRKGGRKKADPKKTALLDPKRGKPTREVMERSEYWNLSKMKFCVIVHREVVFSSPTFGEAAAFLLGKGMGQLCSIVINNFDKDSEKQTKGDAV